MRRKIAEVLPKTPFAARFSFCATVDFNSILKYFPRGSWLQISYQNLWNVSNYWSVKKSRGLFLFKQNEKKNRRGTLTPKTPFAARFSFCTIVDFNSILKYFPRGLWSQILYQNLWNVSNYWSVKKSRGLFLFERNEKKYRRGTLTLKMPFAARFSFCATVDFNSILKYFPRRVWLQILYQNLWNVSNYWSVKKSRGLFLFKRNEKKNRRGTLTPKTPFAARFSFCATVDFNSILKYFPRGLWSQILYQNLCNVSNYWSVKKSRGLFLFERNEKKNRRGTLSPKTPFAARFSFCATVDFNSILKYFPRGLWSQILYQNLWNLSNYWSMEKSRGYFCLNEMRRKIAEVL